MQTKRSLYIRVTLVVTFMLKFAPVHAYTNPIAYTVTDLGTNPTPQSINASGQVTGYLTLGGVVEHPFFYDGATVTDLGFTGKGFGINASGHVAGNYSAGAFVWNGTTMITLATGSSEAFGINASGQVAGDSGGRPVLWTGTTMTDLGTLPGGAHDGIAQGINDFGKVTGYARNILTHYHAFLYSGTTMTDLQTLGGDDSEGFAVNNSGWVTGWANPLGSIIQHAFLYNGATMIDLGTLGGPSSQGYGINAAGDVIGNYAAGAFLYTGGTMYDLNSLLLPGSGVTHLTINPLGNGINDAGQIVATGTIGGESHALLLTPTPEPSSLTILGVAAVALAARRMRRQRR